MRKVFIFTALTLVFTTFAACKKTDNKSAECDVISFTVDSKPWQIQGLNITGDYVKGDNVSNMRPVIVVSEGAKWVSSPASAPYDFSNDKTVTFTVTAEDGKGQKTYTARAMVSMP